MKESKIMSLKENILKGNYKFLDIILEIVDKNKILYDDNYGDLNKDEKCAVGYLDPFMQLLYRGSKHSIGNLCEDGFYRIIVYKGRNIILTYHSGVETYVSVELIEDIKGYRPIVTMDLLRERLQESEDVKNELAPIIEKYLKRGLTFEEITKMFVEIMRENRIKL